MLTRGERNGDNVENSLLHPVRKIELNDNVSRKKQNKSIICYEIMHGEKKWQRLIRGERLLFSMKGLFLMTYIWMMIEISIH